MQQFKVSRQRLILGGSKSSKTSAEYYFSWDSTPKAEVDAKKWVCGVIWDSSIYFTPMCEEEPAVVFVDTMLSELLPRHES